MNVLKSNAELYQYLLSLVLQLRNRGALDLADSIESASRQASGLRYRVFRRVADRPPTAAGQGTRRFDRDRTERSVQRIEAAGRST